MKIQFLNPISHLLSAQDPHGLVTTKDHLSPCASLQRLPPTDSEIHHCPHDLHSSTCMIYPSASPTSSSLSLTCWAPATLASLLNSTVMKSLHSLATSALPLTCCVTLREFLNFSVPWRMMLIICYRVVVNEELSE